VWCVRIENRDASYDGRFADRPTANDQNIGVDSTAHNAPPVAILFSGSIYQLTIPAIALTEVNEIGKGSQREDTKVSRTSNCRRIDRRSSSPGTGPAGAMRSDERLLIELQKLSGQPLEAKYRRKLEAVMLLLRHCDKRQIEERANGSLRTVQRWASRSRRSGPETLRSRVRTCQTSKLSDEQRTHLAADLRRRPAAFNHTQTDWTAALLMRHILQNYGVRFSLRHCRRLLCALGAWKSRALLGVASNLRQTEPGPTGRKPLLRGQPLGDHQCKRRTLVRIKRLASLGMPLQPFAYTLFDLVHDAVPYDEAGPGLAAGTSDRPRWIIRNFDYDRWFPHVQKYLFEAAPEVSGFNPPSLLPRNPLTVLGHEDIVRPDYYRSEGYNEFFRSMGMHHGLLTLLRDDHGRFVGYYPVFRSEMMRPFTRDDIDFFEAAAAHIAHGISTASLFASVPADGDGFEPFSGVPLGVVVTDRKGKLLSLNGAAHSIFRQFALYDGWGTATSTNSELALALSYIADQLRIIFGNFDENAAEADVPIVKMYSHRTGVTLRLRGFASNLEDDSVHLTVLIELGETEELLRQRLAARYALSPRQAEVLMLLRRGASSRELAERLRTRPSALKSSQRELRLKFDLPDQSSLREFARGISAYSMSTTPV
jgi:transposase/DNA-binding CsgD family transcriptional regulator